jgi:hypothetical protein
MPPERGEHVELQREPGRLRVDLGPDDPDHPRLLERAHPVQRRGRRQAGQPGQLDVGPVRVGLQRGQQYEVNFVKVYSHETE